MYLDFSKAFDSIPHVTILYKLCLMGVAGPLCCWFRDYLTNRKHWSPVRDAHCQIKVFLRIAFLVLSCSLYVNDIPFLSSFSSVYFYADDTKLIKSIHSLEGCSQLQEDPDAWCQYWKFTMNLSKCCVLHTSHSCSFQPSSYTIGGKIIDRVSQQKDRCIGD